MRGLQIVDLRNVGGALGGDSAAVNAQTRRSRPEAPPTFLVPRSGLWRLCRSTIQLLLLVGILWPDSLAEAEQPTKQVKVKAKRFKFAPSRIKVKAGTTLEIVLSSQDVRHGFKIVGSAIDVEIPARGKGQAKVEFRADKAGQYRFECSHMCGAGHASMRGVIQVVGRKKNKSEANPEDGGKRE